MINRLLYVATATALISVFMFDENFAANLSQAVGEPIDMWEVGAAGVIGVLAGVAFYPERRR
jgi:predicted membrane protein